MRMKTQLKLLFIIFFVSAIGRVNLAQIEKTNKSPDSVTVTKTELLSSATEKVVDELSPDEQLKRIFSTSKILWAIFFFIIGYYFVKILTKILNKISETFPTYRLTLKGLIPVSRILSWTAIFSFIIIGIFNPPVQSVVLVAGSLGIAIGFAAQDIFKNIFGGIMILIDRPFQVGDKIEVGDHYGEVTSIGLRSTRLVTPDDSMVTVPNGELMAKSISNANSGETNCQVVAEMYLPAYINTEKVRKLAIEAAQVSRYIYLNKPIAVIFKNEMHHDRSLLKLRLKAYVLDIRYEFPFMSEMTEITIREMLAQNLITKEELNGIKEMAA